MQVMYVYLDNTLVGETTGTAGCPSEDQVRSCDAILAASPSSVLARWPRPDTKCNAMQCRGAVRTLHPLPFIWRLQSYVQYGTWPRTLVSVSAKMRSMYNTCFPPA